MKTKLLSVIALALAFASAGAHAAQPLVSPVGAPTIVKTTMLVSQSGQNTYRFDATFNVNIQAVGGDITLGLPASNNPAFSVNSVTVYVNGMPDASGITPWVAYSQPSTTASGPGSTFVIRQNSSVTIPVVVSFMLTSRESDVFGVMMDYVFWSDSGGKAMDALGGPGWYIGFGPAPAASAVDNSWSLPSVSARGNVTSEPLIVGFCISGPRRGLGYPVVLRAWGPTLGTFGVKNYLADPTITIYDAKGAVVGSGSAGWPTSLNTAFASVGAVPFPAGSADCAMLITLQPGAYTAVVRSQHGNTGVSLAEVFKAPLEVLR